MFSNHGLRWLKRKNPAHFLLSTNDKTIKLWKVCCSIDKPALEYFNLIPHTSPNFSFISKVIPQINLVNHQSRCSFLQMEFPWRKCQICVKYFLNLESLSKTIFDFLVQESWMPNCPPLRQNNHFPFCGIQLCTLQVSERDKRAEGYNLKEDSGIIR